MLYGISYGIQRLRLATYPTPIDESFTICDLPCFAGVIPGDSQFESVTATLTRTLPVLTRYDVLYDGNGSLTYAASPAIYDDEIISGTMYSRGQIVSGIHLSGVRLPVQYLFEQLKHPACVSRFQSGQFRGLLLYWLRDDIKFVTILPVDPVASLYEPAYTQDVLMDWQQPLPCDLPEYEAWQGFLPLRYYAPSSG
ncbi:MAG: hypothetical protein ACPG7F_21515 [Aggregatilineales bacterium]